MTIFTGNAGLLALTEAMNAERTILIACGGPALKAEAIPHDKYIDLINQEVARTLI